MTIIKIQSQDNLEVIMNKTKIKATAKKTGQYCVVAPAITLGTFGYATVLTVGKMTKMTGKAIASIAVDTVANTKQYVNDVKHPPIRKDW